MLTFQRFVPDTHSDALDSVIQEVKDHLSSVADSDDDPTTHAEDVVIEVVDHTNSNGDVGKMVKGSLDAEANAPYLRDDFDPEEDARVNPLNLLAVPEDEVGEEGSQ